ncbi:peptidoglycan DD-metalloendopeptidase family protein [Romboutsia lituseburensis]|uniref:peptidoglycan DD-metalloendopeptidase family protein n=1 Tax=Romboutsia lituseburensis TaxID=1537 RepID=UPI00215A686E|nr:peptidoglycan DD-metalloendopeptidase family protein [Romboutsia lituseburensis]MCR8745778.1 peptidoglycan DD-metalloendopeptidase family protein [Romboutsia lituseburensis]
MKKKLLEKDGFYLALFACVCLVAVGGVWFTKNNVDELASNNGFVNKTDESKNDDEVNLIQKDNDAAVPTTTESKDNLEKAKAKEKEQQANKKDESKLNFLGEKVVREYSDKEPTYSKTLNLWEVHKGLDVSTLKGQEIKSLLAGKIIDVFKDDEQGMSVKVKSDNDITVVYSNLSEKINVKKDQQVEVGQVLGTVGNTSMVEGKDGQHVHVEAYKGNSSMNPMSLIK